MIKNDIYKLLYKKLLQQLMTYTESVILG